MLRNKGLHEYGNDFFYLNLMNYAWWHNAYVTDFLNTYYIYNK